MLDNYMNTYPDEIAETLQRLAARNDEITKNDLIEVIYQIRAHAQNKYNSDYWCTLYKVLTLITEKY